ncbi:hypothetical protein [Paenibacillus oryzisoli]|uniref:Uncharacterized protein n=1 Tax=Paenibacillus oryzisoli TaxID=1850517 RepID=A0A198AJZ1_9BACL|nr:hypothetical protein [Paenibacillus oryzisoli]OAS21395.1 hypothetical protein A8708_31505 [Paenibacillus oryzisoli]
MRKTGLFLMGLVCLTLLNPFLPQLRAKMSVFSPQDMIRISDYIVVGEIKKDVTTKKRDAENTATHKEVTISIESVLKGDMAQKEIVLQNDIRTDIMRTDGVDFNFPKKGTKVMLLLRNYESSGISLAYANSICVIKKGKVQVYDGMRFGNNDVIFEPNDYEKAYQTFYDKRKREISGETFKPLSVNPEYIIVMKKQPPNKVLGSLVLLGEQANQIVNEINTSHKLIASKSCDPSNDSFDVVVHYKKGLKDRNFTVFNCPGTIDQASGIMIEPGISVQNFDKLFKQ